ATAGIFRVRPLVFVAIDGFAAMISVPVWILLGRKFGMEAHAHLGGTRAKYVFFGALAIVLVCWIVWELYQKRRHRRRELLGETSTPAPAADAPTLEGSPREAGTGSGTPLPTEAGVAEPSTRP